MTRSPIDEHVATALEALEVRDECVLVACSGGLDSTALLHVMTKAASRFGLAIEVAHVDHGLRGEASEADRKHVEAMAAARGLPCHVEAIDVEAARRPHHGRQRPTLQEAARSLRYDALERVAARVGATRIATAHQLDDQAETVLLRLLRGTSVEGLGGIAESSRAGRVIRPLLGLRRSELEAYARGHGLGWREDASNRDSHYARNRLRNEWLGGLAEAFNPELVRALGRLAEAQRREGEWLAGLVEEAFAERFPERAPERLAGPDKGWSSLPEALARRLAVRALQHLGVGREIDRRHVERAVRFLCAGPGAPGGREIEFPAGVRLRRADKRLVFRCSGDAGESAAGAAPAFSNRSPQGGSASAPDAAKDLGGQ